MNADLEREIRGIGADLVQAYPAAARHPVKALDARALEVASSDRELVLLLHLGGFQVEDTVEVDDVTRPSCRNRYRSARPEAPVCFGLRVPDDQTDDGGRPSRE